MPRATLDRDLFKQLRAGGLRKSVARAVAEAHGRSPKAVQAAIKDLQGVISELESRLPGGGGDGRKAGAQKAAATRKRQASKRSAAARKGAATRARSSSSRSSSSRSSSSRSTSSRSGGSRSGGTRRRSTRSS